MPRLDLNLLRVFAVIFEERTLTAAAERLGLTQPALSHALRRLRLIAEDELFVRSAKGMIPTRQAEELYGRVHDSLFTLDGAMSEESVFDPKSSNRSFTIGMSDYGMTVILPPLIAHLHSEAPRLRIQTRYYAHGAQYEDLFSGRVDLSITVAGGHPEWCDNEDLFTETAVGIAAKSNSLFSGTPTIDEYLGARHVIMTPGEGDRSWVDPYLEALGYVREVAHTVPHFVAIPAILENTEFVSTLPTRIASRFAGQHKLNTFPLPFPAQSHRIVQVWHRRKSRDKGHRWFRRQVARLAKEVGRAA